MSASTATVVIPAVCRENPCCKGTFAQSRSAGEVDQVGGDDVGRPFTLRGIEGAANDSDLGVRVLTAPGHHRGHQKMLVVLRNSPVEAATPLASDGAAVRVECGDDVAAIAVA